MSTDEIATETGRVWLGEDGIIRSVANAHSEETLPTAKANIAAIAHVAGGVPRPVLVDLTGVKAISRDARAYYNSAEAAAHYTAAAMLIGSPLSRVIGNFYMGLNKLPKPARLFTAEDAALAWLREFRP